MGKLKKKGTSGAAVKYITRNQALKKLQVTLADFRYVLFDSLVDR
jgi:pescadillo protein